MIKKLIIIATLVAGLDACKSKSKAAYNYSSDMVAKENNLRPEVRATESNVKKYYEAGQYDSIAVAGENMENLVQKTIDEINAMPVPVAKEADKFKAAVIRYFIFIKSLYMDYKEYGRAVTVEKRQEIMLDIQKIVSQKQDHLDEMQDAQRKYAEANGFKVKAKLD